MFNSKIKFRSEDVSYFRQVMNVFLEQAFMSTQAYDGRRTALSVRAGFSRMLKEFLTVCAT